MQIVLNSCENNGTDICMGSMSFELEYANDFMSPNEGRYFSTS